jgi:ABC-2 type transport system permease protein
MSGAARHLRIVAAQLRVSVLAALAYRVGFWTDGVLGLSWSAMGIVPLFVALEHTQDVAGWGQWELVVLTGCFSVVSGAFGGFVQPALIETMNHIRRGTLDYVLLRPADPLVSCLSSQFGPWRVVEIVAGAGAVGAGLALGGYRPGALDLLTFAGVGLASLVCLYASGVLVLCLSFRALELQNLTFLMEAGLDFARWPASVFRGALRAVFTFVIPFAVMTTFPAEAVLGTLGGAELAIALGVAGALAVLARLAWSRSVAGYTSASS